MAAKKASGIDLGMIKRVAAPVGQLPELGTSAEKAVAPVVAAAPAHEKPGAAVGGKKATEARTFYLDQRLAQLLDDYVHERNKTLPRGKKTSRSDVANHALQAFLDTNKPA